MTHMLTIQIDLDRLHEYGRIQKHTGHVGDLLAETLENFARNEYGQGTNSLGGYIVWTHNVANVGSAYVTDTARALEFVADGNAPLFVPIPDDETDHRLVMVRTAGTEDAILCLDLEHDRVTAGHWPDNEDWHDTFSVDYANPHPDEKSA